MDYKNKLQTNNTALEGNNLDLQTILNTINSLPEAGSGETINLDNEITAQDTLIAELQTVLEGKASGGGVNVETGTITFINDVAGVIGGPRYEFYITIAGTSFSSTDNTPHAFLIKNQFIEDEFIVDNVVCGSSMTIGFFNDMTYKYEIIINDDYINIRENEPAFIEVPFTDNVTIYLTAEEE